MREMTVRIKLYLRMVKGGCIYIMSNKHHTVFYTGVTSDLFSRITEHKENRFPKSFTARYNIHKLVYYEVLASIEEAIDREKVVKKFARIKKLALIKSLNPERKDLFEIIQGW